MPLSYAEVTEMLDRAVGGSHVPVGFHGPFWRNKTRDEFVNTPPFRGIVPVVVGDSAASGIVAALSGTGPFNASAGGIERMPPFGPYLAEEEISAIAEWIDEGCPENATELKTGEIEMPSLKLLHLKDHAKMGRLIEEIAGGRIPRPTTIDEFNTLLLDNGIVDKPTAADIQNGVERHWPNGRPSAIKYVDIPDDTMMVSIPTTAAINEGRRLAQMLTIDGSYPIDVGYDTNYRNAQRKSSLTDDEWDTLYRTRLGDYTVGKCM